MKKNKTVKQNTGMATKPLLTDVHFANTQYGFEWGDAKIERHISDKKKGWIVLGIKTRKKDLQIYVTKTGKIRVHTYTGKEWFEAK